MGAANLSVPLLHHTNVLQGKLLQHQEQGYYRSPETTACVFTCLFQVSDFFRKQEARLILLTLNPSEEGCKETLTLFPQTRLLPGPLHIPSPGSLKDFTRDPFAGDQTA